MAIQPFDYAKFQADVAAGKFPVASVPVKLANTPVPLVPANTVSRKYDTRTIQQRFEKFHRDKPYVYNKLVEFARIAKGIQSCSRNDTLQGQVTAKSNAAQANLDLANAEQQTIDAQNAYTTLLEKDYQTIFNQHPPRYRSTACLFIWKCGKKEVVLPVRGK
jgi:hypothetical protein